MKTRTVCSMILTGIATIALTGISWAQGGFSEGGMPPGAPSGGPPPGGMNLDNLDGNNDGKVSKEEFTTAMEKQNKERFSRMDSNSDGVLSKEEAEKAHGPGHGAGGPGGQPPAPPEGSSSEKAPARPPQFSDMDTNKDNQVSQEEFTKAWASHHTDLFKRIDTNNDGSLSKEELENTPGPGRRGPGGNRP